MPRLVVVIVVLAVSVLAGARLVTLYRENAALRTENARLRAGPSGGAPAPPPAARPPARPPVPPATGGGVSRLPRTLDAGQRQAMLAALAAEPGPDRRVWFQVDLTDPEATAFERQLEEVFREAGWTVHRIGAGDLRFKPGIRLLVADEEWPTYAARASGALEAAGIQYDSAIGYRAYYEEQVASRPEWRGPKLAPDQTYVLVIGPLPAS